MSSDDNLNTKVNLILSAYVVTHRVLTKKPNIIKKKTLKIEFFRCLHYSRNHNNFLLTYTNVYKAIHTRQVYYDELNARGTLNVLSSYPRLCMTGLKKYLKQFCTAIVTC